IDVVGEIDADGAAVGEPGVRPPVRAHAAEESVDRLATELLKDLAGRGLPVTVKRIARGRIAIVRVAWSAERVRPDARGEIRLAHEAVAGVDVRRRHR